MTTTPDQPRPAMTMREIRHALGHTIPADTQPAPDTDRDARPSRFTATPADIDRYLRQHFAEDTLLRYQQAIGGRAVEEAAKDQRADTNLRQMEGENELAGYGRELADLIDPIKNGGPYPSVLLCSRHDGFGPCPGWPHCTSRGEGQPAAAPCADCGTPPRHCGHCRCDRCEDCARCSGGGCTCACEGGDR